MQLFKIPKGIKFDTLGSPEQIPGEPLYASDQVRHVALSGADFRHLQPDFTVKPGDKVAIGQPLFTDRADPRVVFTSPSSGIVRNIRTGSRRTLDVIDIERSGQEHITFKIPPDLHDRESTQSLLLKTGMWPAFKTRPFDRIPIPDTTPADIFVTAMDTAPLAADPRIILNSELTLFRLGLATIANLTDGNTYVCQSPGGALANAENPSIKDVAFSGLHPAGTAGTHINKLSPVKRGKIVWSIHYQDVIAIGHLVDQGMLYTTRVISIAGSGIEKPRLIRVPLGANLAELTDDEKTPDATSIISGSPVSGRAQEWLGRYHHQVTVLADRQPSSFMQSRSLQWLQRYFANNTAIIPETWLEDISPLTPLVVPLLRALAIQDTETAEALGCLEFAADDIAPITHACPTGHDYRTLLSVCLDKLQEAPNTEYV